MCAISSTKLTSQYGRSLDQAISLFRQGKNEEAKALFKRELPRQVKCKIYHKLWETQRILFNAEWGRMSFHDQEIRILNLDQKIEGIEHYLCEELEPLLKKVAFLFRQGANKEAKHAFLQIGKLSQIIEEGIYESLAKTVSHQTLSGKAAFYDLLGYQASCKEKAKAIERFLEKRNYRSSLETLYDWRREEVRRRLQFEHYTDFHSRMLLLADWVPTLYAESLDPKEKSHKVAVLHHRMHPSYKKREEVERVVRKINDVEFKTSILKILKVKRVEGIVWLDIKIDADGIHWYVKMPDQSTWVSVPKETCTLIPSQESLAVLKRGHSIDASIRKLLFQKYHSKPWFLEEYRHLYKKRFFDPYAVSDLFKQQRKRDQLTLKIFYQWEKNSMAKHKYLLKVPLKSIRSLGLLLRGIENESREKSLLEGRKDYRQMISISPYEETVQHFWNVQLYKTDIRFKWKRMNEHFIHPYRSV